MDDTNDFNKRCAEALGWTPEELGNGDMVYWQPLKSSDEAHEIKLMHFHDSYDWAMLLVKECHRSKLYHKVKEVLKAQDRECGSFNTFSWFVGATPQQISQAALEVLERL